jgi:hypothetical protein
MRSLVIVATLIVTHLTVFAVRVIAGKEINADELNLYRESNESSFTHWRRRAVNIAVGVGTLLMIILVVRAV